MTSAVASWLLLMAFASSGGLVAGLLWGAGNIGAQLRPGEQVPPGWSPATYRRRCVAMLDSGLKPLAAMAYSLFPGVPHAIAGRRCRATLYLAGASLLAIGIAAAIGGSVTAGLAIWHLSGIASYVALVRDGSRPLLAVAAVRANRSFALRADLRASCPRCLLDAGGSEGLCAACRARLAPHAFDVRAEPSSLAVPTTGPSTVLVGSARGDVARVPRATAVQVAEFVDAHSRAVSSWHDPDRRGWVWHQLQLALPSRGRGRVASFSTTHLEIRGAAGECLSTWQVATTEARLV